MKKLHSISTFELDKFFEYSIICSGWYGSISIYDKVYVTFDGYSKLNANYIIKNINYDEANNETTFIIKRELV